MGCFLEIYGVLEIIIHARLLPWITGLKIKSKNGTFKIILLLNQTLKQATDDAGVHTVGVFCLCLCVRVCERCRELLHTTAAQELEWSRDWDVRGGQRARAQTLASSVGEDRAMLLGFTMMAFSVLMFFLVGITTVKPYVSR